MNRKDLLLESYYEEMDKANAAENYELAAIYRDKILRRLYYLLMQLFERIRKNESID